MSEERKKPYVKPALCRVDLDIEDAVLACCKTSSARNKTGAKRTCAVAQCISAQTNKS